MAALRWVFLSGFTGSGFCLTKCRAFITIPSSWRRSAGGPRVRLVHPNVFIVHTTTLMRCIKAEGVPSKKARAIISALRKMAHSPAMKPSIDYDYESAIARRRLHESKEEAVKDLAEMCTMSAESRRKVRELLLTLSAVSFVIAGWILLLWERMDQQETLV